MNKKSPRPVAFPGRRSHWCALGSTYFSFFTPCFAPISRAKPRCAVVVGVTGSIRRRGACRIGNRIAFGATGEGPVLLRAPESRSLAAGSVRSCLGGSSIAISGPPCSLPSADVFRFDPDAATSSRLARPHRRSACLRLYARFGASADSSVEQRCVLRVVRSRGVSAVGVQALLAVM